MKKIIFKLLIIFLVLPILSYGQATRVTLSQLAQSGATDGQFVKWNNSTLTWEAGPGAALTGVTGYIPQFNSSNTVDTTSLFWNATTGRLGLGTVDPNFSIESTLNASFGGVQIGRGAGSALVGYNIGIGGSPLNSLTSGDENIGIGFFAQFSNSTGNSNIAIGYETMRFATSSANTAVGTRALRDNTTGQNNTSFGVDGIRHNTTGSDNVAVGFRAGRYIGTGTTSATVVTNSIFIGSDARPLGNSETNQIVIGYQGRGQGSNSVVLGNSDITKTLLYGSVGIGTTAFSSTLDVRGSGSTSSTRSLRISNSLDTTLLFVRNDVKVGIGTTNIDATAGGANLTIGSSVGGSVSLRSGTALVGRFQANSSQVELYTPVGSSEILLTTNAEPRVYVKSDGKVGIGTDTPKSTLQVNGSFGRTPPTIVTSNTAYTVDSQTNPDSWVIFTASSGTITLTLPTASSWTGREITFRCVSDVTVNTNTNIYGQSYTLTTSLLSGVIKTATLVSDGTYWVVVSTN